MRVVGLQALHEGRADGPVGDRPDVLLLRGEDVGLGLMPRVFEMELRMAPPTACTRRPRRMPDGTCRSTGDGVRLHHAIGSSDAMTESGTTHTPHVSRC